MVIARRKRRDHKLEDGFAMERFVLNRMQISDLVGGWIYRDLGEWDRLRELFHSDATIEVTWFEGKATDFVDASAKMGASSTGRTKHMLSSPIVQINGNRAIAETNAIIVAEDSRCGVGCNQHARFFDCLENRGTGWKIFKRQCIYDMGTFTFSRGIVSLDRSISGKYPDEYAPLAYTLEMGGFAVKRVFPTKGSDLEREIKASACDWLQSS